MSRDVLCRMASNQADNEAKKLGLTTLPIDPFQIAKDRGILVRPMKFEESNFSGCLMRKGNSFGILYADTIPSEGFKRFTVGHELGHYFIPGHVEHVFANGNEMHISQSDFTSGDEIELQADSFSAGLLMPKSLFKRAMTPAGEGLSAIQKLADLCQTSLVATAIRYVELSDIPIAVVVSTGTTIDYCFMSEPLKSQKGLRWIRKGTLLPRVTETFQYNADPNNLAQNLRVEGWTTLDLWFYGASRVEVREELIGLGTYGKTLTVLLPEETREEDEEEDDSNWSRKMKRHY